MGTDELTRTGKVISAVIVVILSALLIAACCASSNDAPEPGATAEQIIAAKVAKK